MKRLLLPGLIVLFLLILVAAIVNWIHYQNRYNEIDHSLLQSISQALNNPPISSNNLTSELLNTAVERLRSDNNFYFITALLATIILGGGVSLFIHVSSLQRSADEKMSQIDAQNTSIDVELKSQQARLRVNDETIIKLIQENININEELKKHQVCLRILDLDVSISSVDLVFAILRLAIYVGNWEHMKDNPVFIVQVKNALERAYQLTTTNLPFIGMYELKCVCENIPSHPEIDGSKKRTLERLKLIQND